MVLCSGSVCESATREHKSKQPSSDLLPEEDPYDEREGDSTTDIFRLGGGCTPKSCMYHMVSITRHTHAKSKKKKNLHPD